MSDRPFLILFPGAWGNKTPELATWWFRHVISHFKHDYQIVVVTYEGESLDDYVASAIEQLKDIPDGSMALCYSMGAQIARGVAAQRSKFFKRVALFSGLERTGVAISVFLRGLTFMLIPMLRTLVGRPLMLDTIEQVKRVFLHPLNQRSARNFDTLEMGQRAQNLMAQDLLERRFFPEPSWVVLRLFLPGLRRRFRPFPCPVLAIVPRDDFLVSQARYAGEDVHIAQTSGDHALILDNSHKLVGVLGRIKNWIELYHV